MLSMLFKQVRIDNDIVQVWYAELVMLFAKLIVDVAPEGHKRID